jgi:hypothetical protein
MLCLLSSAEKFLESVEVNQNYPLLLLHLVDKQDVHLTIRVAGAVAFKNYIKRNWKVVSAIFIWVVLLFIILIINIFLTIQSQLHLPERYNACNYLDPKFQ